MFVDCTNKPLKPDYADLLWALAEAPPAVK